MRVSILQLSLFESGTPYVSIMGIIRIKAEDCDLVTYKLHRLIGALITAGGDGKTVGALSQL